jgi:hypothetical protein
MREPPLQLTKRKMVHARDAMEVRYDGERYQLDRAMQAQPITTVSRVRRRARRRVPSVWLLRVEDDVEQLLRGHVAYDRARVLPGVITPPMEMEGGPLPHPLLLILHERNRHVHLVDGLQFEVRALLELVPMRRPPPA